MKAKAKKQIKAIEEHGKQIVESDALIRKYEFDVEDSPNILKEKEIFNNLVDWRCNKALELNKNELWWFNVSF